MMDQREERVFLDVVSYGTNRAIRKVEVHLPGDVYRTFKRTAFPYQGDVQRLSHPTCPSVKTIVKDTGIRGLQVGMDSHGGDLLAEVSRKAKMLLCEIF
jgi:hypothetical protein